MKAVRLSTAVLAVLASCLATLRADASVLTYSLDTEYSGGATPAGPGPWVMATFDDGGSAGSVKLTVTSHLAPGEFVGMMMFNLSPGLDAGDLTAALAGTSGTFAIPTIAFGNNAFSAAGGSAFDIRIDFDNSPPVNRFDGNDSVSFLLAGIPTLTANSFAFTSVGGGLGELTLSAHVQGVGPNANNSGWVTVPEPSCASLLLCGAGLLLRRRRALA